MEERLRILYKTLPFTVTLEDEDEDRAICPICSLVSLDDGGFWIACDGCNDWFDLKCTCTDIEDKKHVPDTYYTV